MKRLPVGFSSFGKLIKGDCVYADKTALIYQMITTGDYYFLSRPRRFGKSLLVSTLEEIFSGNQQFFKNLLIAKSDYDWKKYPVIRLDMAELGRTNPQDLQVRLNEKLEELAEPYHIDLSKRSAPEGKFSLLIQRLAQDEKVVILIDEYDKPILDHITNYAVAEEFRALLQSFYGVIKARDQNIHFAFFTGVTKFSKTSIFSGLNNLVDISMSEDYATLLGYTQSEVEMYFEPHVAEFAQKSKREPSEIFAQLREYYDGYSFAANSEHVYNPFSVLNCLLLRDFDDYWFESGTPSFLIGLVRNTPYGLDSVINPEVSRASLSKCDFKDVSLPSMLFQTGYLTIGTFDAQRNMFRLKVPNREVKDALVEPLLDAFTGYRSLEATQYAKIIFQAFRAGDMADLRAKLQQFLDSMPYHTHVQNEDVFRAILYGIFALIGMQVEPEVATSRGRADLVVQLRDRVYIIELKLDQPAQVALDQIQDREYYAKYQGSGKKITLVGLALDRDTRKIELVSKDI